MSKAADGTIFAIHVQAIPGDVPTSVRLRRALKMLLRMCGLRCVAILEAGKPSDIELEPREGVKRAGRAAERPTLQNRTTEHERTIHE